VVAYYKITDMKAKSIDEAKNMAKSQSLETKYKDEAIYIIYCNRTEYFYIDTNSLLRNWEQLTGYYENGVYNAEN
jgi:glutamyl-tRNA reductase